HTCTLLANGTAKCWGENFFGELGDGTTTTRRYILVPVIGLSHAVAITAGTGYTCALLADGTAKCWGSNDRGQLGVGTTIDISVPGPGTNVRDLIDAVAITAGGGAAPGLINHRYTCALLADGTAKCWGSNIIGELGDGTVMDRLLPVPVAAPGNALTNA